MQNEELFYPGIPPMYPGHYRIRDVYGDIVYWGDTDNLYGTWCKNVCKNSRSDHFTFEYALTDKKKPRYI